MKGTGGRELVESLTPQSLVCSSWFLVLLMCAAIARAATRTLPAAATRTAAGTRAAARARRATCCTRRATCCTR